MAHRLITELAERAGHFAGSGLVADGSRLDVTVDVTAVAGGNAVDLRILARKNDGTVVHDETALLAMASEDLIWLSVTHAIPVLVAHGFRGGYGASFVFTTGQADDEFRQEVTLSMPGVQLGLAYRGAMPNDPVIDRWAVLASRVTAPAG